MSTGIEGRVFLFSWERLGEDQWEPTASSKAAPEYLNVEFRAKVNHGFTNRDCLHCAFVKAYQARDMQFFLQNVQNEMLNVKYNMKFTRTPCILNKQQIQKHHAHDILILSLLLVVIIV